MNLLLHLKIDNCEEDGRSADMFCPERYSTSLPLRLGKEGKEGGRHVIT